MLGGCYGGSQFSHHQTLFRFVMGAKAVLWGGDEDAIQKVVGLSYILHLFHYFNHNFQVKQTQPPRSLVDHLDTTKQFPR